MSCSAHCGLGPPSKDSFEDPSATDMAPVAQTAAIWHARPISMMLPAGRRLESAHQADIQHVTYLLCRRNAFPRVQKDAVVTIDSKRKGLCSSPRTTCAYWPSILQALSSYPLRILVTEARKSLPPLPTHIDIGDLQGSANRTHVGTLSRLVQKLRLIA